MINSVKIAALFAIVPLFIACGNNTALKNKQVIENVNNFSVTAANAPGSYTINGIENATLKLKRNYSYTFNVRTLGHPFYIMAVPNFNPANQYTNGVAGNGVEVGPLTFTVPTTAPDTLYYSSANDSGMNGVLQIEY